MSQRSTLRVFIPVIVLFCATLIGAAYILLIGLTGGPPAKQQPLGSPIDLRGGALILLRLPDRPEQLIIYDSKEAIRDSNPHSEARYTSIELTDKEWQQFEALRQEWCGQPPRFRALTANEAFYDYGMRCGIFGGVIQIPIPQDSLPAILQQLDQRLPPLR